MAQFDARDAVQIDIQNYAEDLAEILMRLQGLGAVEQHNMVTVVPEQPSKRAPHGSVVIYNKDAISG
jgi:hypothetical protein